MANNYEDITARLRKNFKAIIGLYEKQKADNRVLIEENKRLTEQVSSLEKENNGLKNKQENTALTQAFANASGTSHDAKIQVNRIVREIDKCIALLNK